MVYTSKHALKKNVFGIITSAVIVSSACLPVAHAQADGAGIFAIVPIVAKSLQELGDNQQTEPPADTQPAASEEPVPDNANTCSDEGSQQGNAYEPESHHEYNKKLQQRLMDLYYMDRDEPTDYYGAVTQQAVRFFQRKHGLTVDGVAGEETINLLFSDAAMPYTVTVDADGPDVEGIQGRLKELGYPVEDTGYFGSDTEYAVRYFQRMNGLEDDGSVGMETKELLYSKDAVPSIEMLDAMTAQAQQEEEGTGDGVSSDQGESNSGSSESGSPSSSGSNAGSSGNTSGSSGSSNSSGSGNTSKPVEQQPAPTESTTPTTDTNAGDSGNDNSEGNTTEPEVVPLDNETTEPSTEPSTEAPEPSEPEETGDDEGTIGDSGEAIPLEQPAPSDSGATSADSSSESSNSSANSDKVEAFIQAGLAQLGKKYVRGGKGPNSFDCSGFVYYALKQSGNGIGYMTSGGWAKSGYKTISKMSDLQRGDVICFSGHVGIYLGNNEMVDASSSKGQVVRRSLGDWSRRNFICGKRPL